MRPIRLVFVSANALTRRGMSQMVLHAVPPIEVTGTFSDFLSARQYLDGNPVDVILIDETLPPKTDLTRKVRAICVEYVGAAVIVILPRPTASLVQRLLAYGVRGILHKDDDLERDLVQAIIWGKQRGIHLSPGVSHFIETQRHFPMSLNQREFDVLKLLVDGMEPKEIAPYFGVGLNTIYRILRSIRDTFHAQNNAHLITIAHQMKFFEPDDQA